MGPYRICCSCNQEKPVEEFRRRFKGCDSRRHTDCLDCYRDYNRRRREMKRASSIKGFARCAAKADHLSQVGGLLTAMVRRCGGLEAFAQLWVDSMQAAAPGSRSALSSFKAIANMVRHNAAEGPQPKNPEDMTDAEIDAELKQLLAEMIIA